MKILKIFLTAVILTLSVSASIPGSSETVFFKKADTYMRVFHDGFYWIQVFTDDGDFVNEFLDPNQNP